MGPYTCYGENCGKRTDNDNHLCDEHDLDQQPEPELCHCGEPSVGYDATAGVVVCAKCFFS